MSDKASRSVSLSRSKIHETRGTPFLSNCVSSYQVHIEAGFMMDFVFNLIGFAVEQR